MKVKKIHILYDIAAKRSWSLNDLRHVITNDSREIARLKAARDLLKRLGGSSDDRAQIPHIEQQLANREQHKMELHRQEAVLEAEFKETTKLREACERWLSNRGVEIPPNQSQLHTYSYTR